jgi:hypothetical protein
MVPRRAFLELGAGLVGTLCLTGEVVAQIKPQVEGIVLDKGDRPIQSVLVTAYRRSMKIGQFATENNGRYRIEFNPDGPIDTLRYERTSYIAGVVNDLSGALDHNINKVLYLRGTPLNLFEGQEALAALERIYYIETETPNTSMRALRATYEPVLNEMWEKTLVDVPPTLRQRLEAVIKLFRTG